MSRRLSARSDPRIPRTLFSQLLLGRAKAFIGLSIYNIYGLYLKSLVSDAFRDYLAGHLEVLVSKTKIGLGFVKRR